MRAPLLAAVALLFIPSLAAADMKVGVAEVDITPDYPVRLSGFGFRRTESEGVTHRIFARAIAFDAGGAEASNPAVILCVDNLAVPAYMTREVATRLKRGAKLDPNRLAVTCTHTHTAPMLTGVCPTLFGVPIPAEHQVHIDRYTRELTDHLAQVALAALADLKPATVDFGIGSVDFAINRRTKGGPVDHDLPVLAIKDPDGKLRAVYLSYACHCVTLSNNKVSGDWAGFVTDAVHKTHPDVMVLTSVGCGADSNPDSGVTGDKVDAAAAQGTEIATELDRLLKQGLKRIDAAPATKVGQIELMFDRLPTRDQWQEKAKRNDAVGHHARVQLAKLDRGEELQTKLPYPIQTWAFGDQLAMVFLPGEVVVDYSLRLKREYARDRLWVNAYSNDEPCYIPSERVLKEGGYEGGDAMVYYDRPTKFAVGLEERIVGEVARQLPKSFAAPKSTEGVAPKSPEESRRAIRTKPGLEVELVAAEPLVTSPVAIDWGADGKLWVCEMFDYPTGLDGKWQPGGRVKFLRDADGDGRYDTATVFLDNLPFPTGVTAWGRGVLVCAAPDILYAEDTDGDGKADKVEKLFSGFVTENYQARVNSLSLGLDNWIYGANGLLGGVISGRGGTNGLDLRSRDFRFRLLTGPMETVTGLTQQGRVRDDWGRWFGCDNSTPLLYYPHEQRYLARNPHAPAPPPALRPPGDFDTGRVFPASRLLERFNDPSNANRVTSGCGLGIYRDTLLGEQFYGNAFVCEPVHNLVHRMVLSGDEGAAVRQARATDERESEFFASADNWCRPVQARTGPDGALYVVDMYRFLIEHPRWIQPDRLARIDVRAGADEGRIYRVAPAGATRRPVPDLTGLPAQQLAAALDSPNGTERDRVHVELLARHDPAAAPALERIASSAALPQVRLQALCALEGLGALKESVIVAALKDGDEHVRKQAVRVSESVLKGPGPLLALTGDGSKLVRRQLAFTLGKWDDARAGEALANLARTGGDDPELRVAILSSAGKHCGAILSGLIAAPEGRAHRTEWLAPLVATAAASSDESVVARALSAVLPREGEKPGAEHFAAVAALLDAMEHKGRRPDDPRLADVIDLALHTAADDTTGPDECAAALRLLGRGESSVGELALLCGIAGGSSPAPRAAALEALRRQRSAEVGVRVLASWPESSPAARPGLINLLLTRDEWSAALLDAVKRRRVGSAELSLYDRQRLAQSPSEAVRKAAAEAFPPSSADSRAAVVARYAPAAALPGDSAAGGALFAANCAACHRLGAVGHDVGPDLSALRDKDAGYFVQNVLDPGAVVEPRFVNYVVATKDGRTLSGVIKSETDNALTLATGGGATETVSRADVKSVRATGVSMMPEGFEAAFTAQQLADVIAFVKSGPRKQFPGNDPAAVSAGADGSLVLPARAAEIYGEQIALESEFHNLGMWTGGHDYAAWTATVAKAGDFDVYFDYACARYSAGNNLRLAAGEHAIVVPVAATGTDWSRYARPKVGTLRLDSGSVRITARPEGPLHDALIDLRTIVLVPAGNAPPHSPAPSGAR